VLSFGRLLPYKGLDLLAAAWRLLPAGAAELRVVGSGPESPALDALRALPAVTVENRWVPEAEVGALFGWADAVVLSHTEASQSGVAAAARAAGRWIVGTGVGGLAEQLREDPNAVVCAAAPASLAAGILSLSGQVGPPAPLDAAAAWGATAAELVRQLRREGLVRHA
jgi:glycosyltransferase involved in cell wall biosynthesis